VSGEGAQGVHVPQVADERSAHILALLAFAEGIRVGVGLVDVEPSVEGGFIASATFGEGNCAAFGGYAGYTVRGVTEAEAVEALRLELRRLAAESKRWQKSGSPGKMRRR